MSTSYSTVQPQGILSPLTTTGPASAYSSGLALIRTFPRAKDHAGIVRDPAWAKPLGPYHPRAYGTYPRVLGKYVRDEGVLPLEEAVRKMTWSVAQRLGLKNRGILREGAYADIVMFDPETIADRATFEEPHQLSVGVEHVWVNGVQVVAAGIHTGAKPGRFVRPHEG